MSSNPKTPYCTVTAADSKIFVNANIFDGKSDELITGMSVLVSGDKIQKIAPLEDLQSMLPEGTETIDAAGRTLMPGFCAMHEHVMFQASAPELLTSDSRYIACVATETAKIYLMNGFTSVRDAAGDTFGLKRAIDKGHVWGPRIHPSGAMISQSGGHADHRMPAQPSCFCEMRHDNLARMGDMCVVDGHDEVLKAAREQLRLGASQIKIAVGGGTGSYSDPLEVVEFTAEEIQAAVSAASDYNTYVMAHVYNTRGVQRAIENGVKCIEHGNLLDEETLQMMKDKDVWLSPQVAVYQFIPHGYTEDQANKHRQAQAGIDNLFTTCKQIGYNKIVFGSDIITDQQMVRDFNKEFQVRTKWFSNFEVLQQATKNSGELLAMGERLNPGKVGVIEEGCLADILLVNGNPLEDIGCLVHPAESLALIMKGGHVYKNAL